MRKLEFKIALGLGDNILLRMALDTIKHNYDEIRISHDENIMQIYRNNDPAYQKFMDDIGNLLFTEPPYIFDHGNYPIIYTYNTYKSLNTIVKKPQLEHLLCQGNSLNLKEEYIVLTTKIRTLPRTTFDCISNRLWKVLNELTNKYKIVIIGERVLEKNPWPDDTYSIYNDVVSNLPKHCLIDLTIPALGETSPTLKQVQQDCLIMKEAKFTIANGIGGNVWMAAAAGKVIGYRTDNADIIEWIVNPQFENIFITKDENLYLNKLKEFR
jgi:hypothetical protein